MTTPSNSQQPQQGNQQDNPWQEFAQQSYPQGNPQQQNYQQQYQQYQQYQQQPGYPQQGYPQQQYQQQQQQYQQQPAYSQGLQYPEYAMTPPATTPPAKPPLWQRPKFYIPVGILVVLIILGALIGTDDSTNTTQNKTDNTGNSQQDNQNAPAQNNDADQPSDMHTMTYILETDGPLVDAFYWTDSGTAQEDGVASGWSKDVQYENKWDTFAASVSGTLLLGEEGTVTCRILWDGNIVAENTSSGSTAHVHCSPDMDKM